ncbi:MAG: tRNA 4-thiouridine(8) synthase ThiI [Desulfotomaculales bacterium]
MKAIALLSGGLDSMLAVKVIQEQGIEVVGVAFTSPFFGPEKARRAAEQLGIALHVIDITDDFMPLLLRPRYGYGRNMNPCIDCHALMLKKAGELMERLGASFVITGEVLGERPKSQNAQALHIVARDAGLAGYVLRPLSARLLPPTVPEEKGWVDRDRLLAIQGRSRKPQMALAEKYGLKEYPTPAGGCLLTDPGLSRRLKELLADNPVPTREDLELVKYGRHFRLPEGVRIIVARNEGEIAPLLACARPGDYVLRLKSVPGPRTLVRGKNVSAYALRVAGALTARYSKRRDREKVHVLVEKTGHNEPQELELERSEIGELVAAVSYRPPINAFEPERRVFFASDRASLFLKRGLQ